MNSAPKVRWLTESDVRQALDLPALVRTMESTLSSFSARRVTQPVRSVLQFATTPRFFALMPAWLPEQTALGAKLVSVVPDNAAAGLPTHVAAIALFDPDNGALRALLDGRYITEVRTAAVSLLSVRHLARPDAHRLAIIGSGVQARSHLAFLLREGRLDQVRVWGPDHEQVLRFTDDTSTGRIPVLAAGSAEEALDSADVVVLATSSPTPVVHSDWIAPGTHVVSIGACRPNEREMDPALLARGRLFVDSRAAAAVESGDIVMGIAERRFDTEHIVGELGDVLRGCVAGRTDRGEVTVFKSLGLAVEDVAAAQLAYEVAIKRGIGIDLSL
jgi:ornithine cyclodeaminase